MLITRPFTGNPFFINEFLKSIISDGSLFFCPERKSWHWDDRVIHMQFIARDVSSLLASNFNRLPLDLTKTVTVASCLGSQIEEWTIDSLNAENRVLPFDMKEQLKLAVGAGIMEQKAGLYTFKHDQILHTIYDQIPPESRKMLHKTIGESLLKAAEAGGNSAAIHLLATDQLNFYCKDDDVNTLNQEERSLLTRANATAAKFAIAASSFKQGETIIGFELFV